MAILTRRPNLDPKPTPVKQTSKAVIREPEYKGATVDTRYIDNRSLITHVEGSSWVVCYYQQLLGSNDEVTPQELSKDAVYQQYMEIKSLELKVTTPLSQTQDDATKNFDVTGAGYVYPPVIPNNGDMFLADIGDGKEGVFTITQSRRLSMLTESVFEIEYVLKCYSNDQIRNDLNKKVVKRTHFVKDLINHGEDPIVVTEDYNHLINVENLAGKLLGQYLGTFFSKSIQSLEVPDQPCITYDPFVVKFLKSIFNTDEHPIVQKLKIYSVELAGRDIPSTIWDVLLRMDISELPMCHEKLALVDARYFARSPQYEGVAFSNVQDVVYPIDRNNTDLCKKQIREGRYDARDIRHQFITSRLGNIGQLNKPKGEGIEALYEYHPVTKDDYYIFSEAFYFHNYQEQSQLESITRNAIENKGINREILVKLCEDSHKWPRLERFYFTPILLLLLKLARQGG